MLNAIVTALNEWFISSLVSTQLIISFQAIEILATTTDYIVDVLPTYNSENDVNVG